MTEGSTDTLQNLFQPHVWSTTQEKVFSLYLNGISYFSLCDHYLLSYHGAPLRRVWLIYWSNEVLNRVDKFTPNFLSPAEWSYLATLHWMELRLLAFFTLCEHIDNPWSPWFSPRPSCSSLSSCFSADWHQSVLVSGVILPQWNYLTFPLLKFMRFLSTNVLNLSRCLWVSAELPSISSNLHSFIICKYTGGGQWRCQMTVATGLTLGTNH